MANAASDYVYKHVSPDVLFADVAFSEGAPKVGETLPAFDLPDTEGGRVRFSDFRGKRPLLLVTGSLTCPMTASSNPKIRRLHHRFGTDFEFVMLHVREAHPGEHRDQPRTEAEKIEHARKLRARDRLPWKVAVDDLEGTMHRKLDEKPNAAYVADKEGRIVYRSLWAADYEGLREAMLAVREGRRPDPSESTHRLGPMLDGIAEMRQTMLGAGPRAAQDMWRAAPPMAAMAWLVDLYRPLPPRWRVAAAAATVGVSVAIIGRLLAGAVSGRRQREGAPHGDVGVPGMPAAPGAPAPVGRDGRF